ncbi:MAG: hypothetical protein ACREIF_02460 [Chthoniobacterales bacterium]
MNLSWHHVVAYALTIFAVAGFSQIRLERATNTNTVVISAHEYTEAAHEAIAALHIPGVTIIDMEKVPKPDFIMHILLSFFTVGVTLAVFLFFVWLLRRISPD